MAVVSGMGDMRLCRGKKWRRSGSLMEKRVGRLRKSGEEIGEGDWFPPQKRSDISPGKINPCTGEPKRELSALHSLGEERWQREALTERLRKPKFLIKIFLNFSKRGSFTPFFTEYPA